MTLNDLKFSYFKPLDQDTTIQSSQRNRHENEKQSDKDWYGQWWYVANKWHDIGNTQVSFGQYMNNIQR